MFTTTVVKPQRPPDSLEWKDDAIVHWLELALVTHDRMNDTDNNHESMDWTMPALGNPRENETLQNWKPNSLELPTWAVDPFSAVL